MRMIIGLIVASLISGSNAKAQVLCGKIELANAEPLKDVFLVLVPDTGNGRTAADSVRPNDDGEFCVKATRAGIYGSVIRLRTGAPVKVAGRAIIAPDSIFATITVDTIKSQAKAAYGKTTDVRMAQPAKLGGYPRDLADVKARGSVLLSFVVNAAGRVDPASVRVIRSDDHRFTQAIRDQIQWLRFHPATINGRKVSTLVQQPFSFEPRP